MNYLEKLKKKISLHKELPLLPKVKKPEKEPTSRTALTAKSTLGTLGSTKGRHFSGNKKQNPEDCPARCKLTEKCYGIAYFDAKPGKTLLCIPNQCPWSDQLKQHFNKKEN